MAVEYTYTVEVEQETTEICGYYASGDDAQDRADEQAIIDRVNSGDVWAWASVRVHAYATIDGVQYEGVSTWLGACSYADESDFCTPGSYFDDLCAEARADVESQKRWAVKLPDGSTFTRDESRQLAVLLVRRFGGLAAGTAAWRRALQNRASESDLKALIDGAG